VLRLYYMLFLSSRSLYSDLAFRKALDDSSKTHLFRNPKNCKALHVRFLVFIYAVFEL